MTKNIDIQHITPNIVDDSVADQTNVLLHAGNGDEAKKTAVAFKLVVLNSHIRVVAFDSTRKVSVIPERGLNNGHRMFHPLFGIVDPGDLNLYTPALCAFNVCVVDGPLPYIVGKVHMVMLCQDPYLVLQQSTQSDVVANSRHPLRLCHIFIGRDVVVIELCDAGHVDGFPPAVADGDLIQLDGFQEETMEDLQSLVGGTVVVLGLHALVVVLEGCIVN